MRRQGATVLLEDMYGKEMVLKGDDGSEHPLAIRFGTENLIHLLADLDPGAFDRVVGERILGHVA